MPKVSNAFIRDVDSGVCVYGGVGGCCSALYKVYRDVLGVFFQLFLYSFGLL